MSFPLLKTNILISKYSTEDTDLAGDSWRLGVHVKGNVSFLTVER